MNAIEQQGGDVEGEESAGDVGLTDDGATGHDGRRASLESPPNLTDLAATINREHDLAYRAALNALQHAILCGEALIAARDTVPDGEWLRWVSDNLHISTGALHRYVRIATYKEQLLTADRQPKSINAAISYLKEVGAPAAGTGKNGRKPTFDVEEAKRLRKQGLTFTEIGPLLGVSDVAVWRQLTPGAARKTVERTNRYARQRRAERRALQQKERDEAVARVGGSASNAYAALRRCALIIDRAITEATGEMERAGLRNALAFAHRAEDAIVAVLQLERQAS